MIIVFSKNDGNVEIFMAPNIEWAFKRAKKYTDAGYLQCKSQDEYEKSNKGVLIKRFPPELTSALTHYYRNICYGERVVCTPWV